MRRFFADTYIDLGEAYTSLASQSPLSPRERREHWRVAREMYGRSAEIWEDLVKLSIMVPLDAGKPDAVTRQIARLDTALTGP